MDRDALPPDRDHPWTETPERPPPPRTELGQRPTLWTDKTPVKTLPCPKQAVKMPGGACVIWAWFFAPAQVEYHYQFTHPPEQIEVNP